MQRKVTYLWKEPLAAKQYRSAVSLHGHTNHSKEGLYFIAEFAAKHTVLRRALAEQERRARNISAIKIDFWKGYWTPPLTRWWRFNWNAIRSKTCSASPA